MVILGSSLIHKKVRLVQSTGSLIGLIVGGSSKVDQVIDLNQVILVHKLCSAVTMCVNITEGYFRKLCGDS